MNVSAAEIETIVRRVLSSLAVDDSPSGASTVSAQSDTVHVDDAVVSLESVRRLRSGRITVRRSAVVTPAARDFCRDQGILIQHGDTAVTVPLDAAVHPSSGIAETSKPQRLFVTGSVIWLKTLERQLCPKQSVVSEIQSDDASAMRSVAGAIRRGHASALAIVSAPHSALWQAARDEQLRPALVSQWNDLNDILREVPANVLIVSSKTWNVAAIANVARRYLQFLGANA
jgi:hypothetical protein